MCHFGSLLTWTSQEGLPLSKKRWLSISPCWFFGEDHSVQEQGIYGLTERMRVMYVSLTIAEVSCRCWNWLRCVCPEYTQSFPGWSQLRANLHWQKETNAEGKARGLKLIRVKSK